MQLYNFYFFLYSSYREQKILKRFFVMQMSVDF